MWAIIEAIRSTIPAFFSANALPLGIGLILGIAVALLLRARQVYANRRAFGYSVDRALTLNQRLRRWAFVALIAFGVVGGAALWRSLRPAPAADLSVPVVEVEHIDPLTEMRLVIPRLAVEAEMIPAPFVARQWDISRLRDEVAHLEGTALPGTPGNAVLAGHVTIPNAGWGPFRELDTLAPGDRIFIEIGADRTLIYQVEDVTLVEPDDVHVTYPTEDTRLTLITCAGWSDILQDYAQRVVVVAKPLN